MAEIGLAVAEEIPALREIEGRAAKLFLMHPQTTHLPLVDAPVFGFTRAQEQELLWVARVAGKPGGFALVEDFGASLHLEELDVAPEFGRQGIGRNLVETVINAAVSKGLPVTLCTFSEVPWNAPFYERLGFVRLDSEQLEAALRDRVREEMERGLPAEVCVAMLFDVQKCAQLSGQCRVPPGWN